MTELALFHMMMAYSRALASRIRADERGEVTKKVLIIAVFAALAIAVGAIITIKVIGKANDIPTK